MDELIFNLSNLRDRLILELEARCGLRIGEVLGLKVSDVSTRKLLIREPKSGKEAEVTFMPEHIAQRMVDYITTLNLSSEDRLFKACYTTARNLVHQLGAKLNLNVSPHDLRRHSATYASRNGIPLEIISKAILRHQDLKTTQIYLGKVSDAEQFAGWITFTRNNITLRGPALHFYRQSAFPMERSLRAFSHKQTPAM